MCDEVINITDSVSRNVINTVSANVTSTASINSDDKKARNKMDYYIHSISLVIISLSLLLAVSSDGVLLLFYKSCVKNEKRITILIQNEQCKSNHSRTYYVFSDMIKIKNLDPKKIK